ncbi:unnamed protein product [Larinioides sclopetarius]|uniref:Uncharacterized protein n=1 Tax=Larinioides sclopetarius TaxID=280406 RepID=A0AAV2AKE6_9ARAC
MTDFFYCSLLLCSVLVFVIFRFPPPLQNQYVTSGRDPPRFARGFWVASMEQNTGGVEKRSPKAATFCLFFSIVYFSNQTFGEQFGEEKLDRSSNPVPVQELQRAIRFKYLWNSPNTDRSWNRFGDMF